ncbi:MAG: hypothetical protein IPF71_13860 [Rhodoferax sp.]|nr:hypothetical protein [Rhodoferax sp.]
MKTAWINTLTWVAIVLLALALAFIGPKESSVMGKLPQFMIHSTPDAHTGWMAPAFSADRTLALVTFSKKHRPEAESWIRGLQLQNDSSISWVRMPVLKDPGDAAIRDAMEVRVRSHYPAGQGSGNLLPIFADRNVFVQSAGLNDTEHAYVLVLGRQGEVLARVAGQFDEAKAEALRETLTIQGL